MRPSPPGIEKDAWLRLTRRARLDRRWATISLYAGIAIVAFGTARWGGAVTLVASALAYAVVERPWLTWRPMDLDWSVATLNMVGSIAFMASALAAFVLEDGSLRNAELANSGTWVGGVCFLVGAIFLIPEEIDAELASADR